MLQASQATVSGLSSSTVRELKIVTHHYPDTDAMANLWAAVRFVAKDLPYTICFVRAGESLSSEECDGYEVITMDTGHGKLDQHGKFLGRTSSFRLFCAEYNLLDDPGIKPILDLTIATDNVEKVDATSIHYVIKGLPYHFRDLESKETNWQAVCDFAFILFDVVYSQGREKVKSEAYFKRMGKIETLPNGLKIGFIWHHPRLRQAAYDAGCDVAVWSQDLKGERKGKFYVGIQVNNKSDDVTLEQAMESLRRIEAGKRGVEPKGSLRAAGMDKSMFGAWYLHDSLKLIVCGSRGHEAAAEECTLMSTLDIANVLRNRLAKLPPKK